MMLAFELKQDNSPTFTTPSFDFESHSSELLSMVNQVFEYRDYFWSSAHEKNQMPCAGVDLEQYKNDHLRKAVDNLLIRFNLLTTSPPLKKRAASNLRAVKAGRSAAVNAAVDINGIVLFNLLFRFS
jgi:hypothetical protein